MRENEVSCLVQEIGAGQGRVLLVSGDSGVGKTTVIAEALSRTKNTESTIFYPFGEDPIQFKIFLNELLLAEMAKRPLLSRLFRKRFRLVGVHVQPLKGFSIDFYNRDYDDAPLNERWSAQATTFESSFYRLNGTPRFAFFERLWRTLNKNGLRVVHLANLERATPEELDLIRRFIQTGPKTTTFILEYGLLSVGAADLNRTRTAIEMVREIRECVISPFDESSAFKFYQLISQHMPTVPNFDFSSNQGNAFAICFDVSQIDGKYAPSKLIEPLLGDETTRSTLFLLTAFSPVITALSAFIDIAAAANVEFDLSRPLAAGIVRVSPKSVTFAHTFFPSYLRAVHAGEFSTFINSIAGAVHDANPSAYAFLQLRQLDECATEEIEIDVARRIRQTLVSLIDIRNMRAMALLVPICRPILKRFPRPERIIIDLILAQYDIYSFHPLNQNSGDFSPPVNALYFLLNLQHLYHINNFEEAIAQINTKAPDLLAALVHHNSLIDHVIGVMAAFKGVCLSALGEWNDARVVLAAINTSRLIGKVAHYALTWDGLVSGYEFEARKRWQDVSVDDAYAAPKVQHNILASAISLKRITGVQKALEEEIIPQFARLKSREITYPINNLAVVQIMQGNYSDALVTLETMRDKTFEVYDVVCCNLNTAIAYLGLHDDRASEAATSAYDIVTDKGFRDPYFCNLTYLLNGYIALAYDRDPMQFVRCLALGKDVALTESDLTRKIATLRKWAEDGYRPPAQLELAATPTELAILHFWDFNVPLIDESVVHAFCLS